MAFLSKPWRWGASPRLRAVRSFVFFFFFFFSSSLIYPLAYAIYEYYGEPLLWYTHSEKNQISPGIQPEAVSWRPRALVRSVPDTTFWRHLHLHIIPPLRNVHIQVFNHLKPNFFRWQKMKHT
ncbi:hypothetical protein GGR53DRAFT_416496 [Hypoxylon sp. FL1150]|nr:hypothetical protein GGR53DRAFT_416496 [Hypoxylon sp. FL1150]